MMKTVEIMKYLASVLPVLILASGCVMDKDDPVWSLAEGDRLPEFSVETADGRGVSTEGLAGNVSVLVFFNTSCSDCQAELPNVQAAYDRFADVCDSDVDFLCISRQEGRDAVMSYWSKCGFTLPVSPQDDREVYDKFASSGIPRIYVADRHGIITTVFSDSRQPSAVELVDAVNAALVVCEDE